MRIVIEQSGQIIGFDKLVSATFRTDLTPIPVNLEMTLKLDKELEKQIKEDAVLLVGDDQTRVTIVKVTHMNTQMVVDDKRLKAVSIIAVLSGCEMMMEALTKAVILRNTNFAGAYRACGCKLKFSKDIPILSFASAYGSIPTTEVASCLQEESAMIYFDKGKLSVQRLQQFFSQEPAFRLDNSAVAWINNPKVENKQVAGFVSVTEDGGFVEGNLKNKARASYYPDADARRLKNLNTVLVTRGTVTRTLDLSVYAGDVILVDETKYLVLTAAHLFKTGALGGGTASASRYWLAKLSN